MIITMKKITNKWCKERIKILIPAELIVLIIGTAVGYLTDVSKRWNVIVVGSVPVGLPAPMLPSVTYTPNLIVDAVIGAF